MIEPMFSTRYQELTRAEHAALRSRSPDDWLRSLHDLFSFLLETEDTWSNNNIFKNVIMFKSMKLQTSFKDIKQRTRFQEDMITTLHDMTMSLLHRHIPFVLQ